MTVGLIAVASWQNYAAVSGLVSKEASTIGVLYRDVVGYPEPLRTELRHGLREYTVFLVDKVWPAQQTGQLLDEPTAMLTTIHGQLLSYHPPDSGASIMHAEAMHKFDDLIDLRRQRVDRVDEGLPGVLWVVVGIGALVTLVVRLFIWVDNVRVHALMLTLLGDLRRPAGVPHRRAGPAVPRHGERFSSQAYRLIVQRVMDPLDAAAPAGQ